MVTKWQEKSRLKHEVSFVYLSDEFYIAANQPIPSYEHYDEFPQLENGIGLVRNFLTEWESSSQIATDYSAPTYIDIVCGRSAEKILKPLLNELVIPNLYIRIVPIENRFFGSDITVTGLLTGQDIVTGLSSLSGERTGIIIPGIALRKGEDVFLDDSKWQDIEKQLNIPVRVAYSAADLKRLLYQWS